MNQYLVDAIVDHDDWIRYIRPRKMCYSDSINEKYVSTDVYRKLEKIYLKNMPVDDYYWYYMYLSYLERLNET